MRTRRFTLLAASVMFSATLFGPEVSCASGHSSLQLDPKVQVAFRLHVNGRPAPGATFWVAYGPTMGKFGLVRLTSSGSGTWFARQRLPAGARLNLVYLMGRGTVHTRFGAAPGNPVATIRHLPSFLIRNASSAVVYWQAPAG